VVVLRRTRPDLPRAFRAPLVPWLPAVSVLASLWLMLNLPVITWVRFLIWMAAGLVMYFVYGMRRAAKADAAATGGEPSGTAGKLGP
jgi:APA family basic amino acid/polyamine antiporter